MQNTNRPIDVTVEDGRRLEQHPILTHVEVMHSHNQGDQRAHVQGCLPMIANVHGFHQEEYGRGNHGDGDDPESDGDGIREAKEDMVLDGSGTWRQN